MKKTALTVILTLTLLFTACGSAESVSIAPTSNSESASSTGVCSFTAPEVFGSVKELLAFLQTNGKLRARVLKTSPRLDDPENLYVFAPNQVMKGFHLNQITQSGSYINYEYRSSGYQNPEPGSERVLSQSSRPSEAVDEEANRIASEMERLGGYEGYVQQYGLSDHDRREINNLQNRFTLSYNLDGYGKIGIKNFVESNAGHVFEFPGHPGYYYSEVTRPGWQGPVSYMIYWSQEGFSFHAGVPYALIGEFFELADGKKLLKTVGEKKSYDVTSAVDIIEAALTPSTTYSSSACSSVSANMDSRASGTPSGVYSAGTSGTSGSVSSG